MAMHPIGAASSHPELRSSDPQSPSLEPGSLVPTTQEEKIPQLRFPSLDSGARRVKPPIDSETFENGRRALTSPRSRKGIFHLPVPLQTRAAGVLLGGGALSEALRPWNPRSRGIPVLHRPCSGKSQGGAGPDQNGPLRSSAGPSGPKSANITAPQQCSATPSLKENSGSLRPLTGPQVQASQPLHPNLQDSRSLS